MQSVHICSLTRSRRLYGTVGASALWTPGARGQPEVEAHELRWCRWTLRTQEARDEACIPFVAASGKLALP